jgi:nucleolar protein 16
LERGADWIGNAKDQLTASYAALGLLPSIPLPTGASSSTTHRAPINLPSSSSGVNSEGGNEEVTPKVSYGRIIRDDQGNVIDIILDDEESEGMKDGEGEVEGALNPAKEWVPEKVEAKTDVVRCESFYPGIFPSPSQIVIWQS